MNSKTRTNIPLRDLFCCLSRGSARQVESRQWHLWRKSPVTHQHCHQKDFERQAPDSFPVPQLPADLQRHHQEQWSLWWVCYSIKHQEGILARGQPFNTYCMCVSTPVQVGVPLLSMISGGGLPTSYKAVQFHLHWGKNGGPGSEHTIDGEQYPMEVPYQTKHTWFIWTSIVTNYRLFNVVRQQVHDDFIWYFSYFSHQRIVNKPWKVCSSIFHSCSVALSLQPHSFLHQSLITGYKHTEKKAQSFPKISGHWRYPNWSK